MKGNEGKTMLKDRNCAIMSFVGQIGRLRRRKEGCRFGSVPGLKRRGLMLCSDVGRSQDCLGG